MFVKPYFLRNSAEDGNAKISISANIPCTFLFFQGSTLLQIFFPIKFKFWEGQFFLIVKQIFDIPVFTYLN